MKGKRVICPKCGKPGLLYDYYSRPRVVHSGGKTCYLPHERVKLPRNVKQRVVELLKKQPMTRAELEAVLGLPHCSLADVLYKLVLDGRVKMARLYRCRRGRRGDIAYSGRKLWGRYAGKGLYFLEWQQFIDWALEKLPVIPANVGRRQRRQMLALTKLPDDVLAELVDRWHERDKHAQQFLEDKEWPTSNCLACSRKSNITASR